MDAARYVIALLLIVMWPPAIAFWLVVHPFIHFWRRAGPWKTYASVLPAVSLLGVVTFRCRELLLSVEFGTNPWLVPPALVALGFALWIGIACRRLLRIQVLVGLPELSPDGVAQELLTDGIYARIRHPRYASAMLALLAWALIANYLALYALCALLVPAMLALVHFEERELRERFGADYVRYSRSVPRFVPRLRRR